MELSTLFTIAVVVLIFVIIFQIAKASEYVNVLKGEERANKANNKVNAFFMVAFLVLGLIGVYWCNELFYHKTLFAQPAASDHGEKWDSMFKWTIVITGIVFFATQILLFGFAYRYQYRENQKAYFFPHNNTMELVWTVVPAIALTVLVVIGLYHWFAMTSEPPKNAIRVEITGKQFGWIFRYPGKDKQFGEKYYKVIDDANSNPIGQIWRDSAALNLHTDPRNFDDVVATQTMYVVKGRPVQLLINSRDVIHDVGLPHFRMKMDAVPGTPTTMWFTPLYTTKEMKEKLNKPDFQYEIACDQLCGNGHYSMKGVIEVVTQPEFDEWMAKQKPNYYAAFPDKDPANANKPPAGTVADTAVTKGGGNATVMNK